MNNTLFITFEGIEGCSKSTQSQMLYDWMQQKNIDCVITKEPGSPHIEECKKIREIVLNPKNEINPTAELFLFLADRAQHVDFIKENLKNGKCVICDRYIDSTRAYQSARGFSRSKIDDLLSFAINDLYPDLTILLDLDVEIGLKRAKKVSEFKGGDRMELAEGSFHSAVRYNFLQIASSITDQHRFKVVDANQTIDTIHKEIVHAVSRRLW